MATQASTRTLAAALLDYADPNAVAVTDTHVELTYGELDCLSNRVARALRAVGVNGSFAVGLVFRTSAIAIVVECALAKIGAPVVAVPSATAAPERRNHPAYATTARAVVTTTEGLARIPDYVPAIALDSIDIQRLVAAVSEGPLEHPQADVA